MVGVTESGEPTHQWLAMIRKRLPPPEYEAAMRGPKLLINTERAWVALIRSRAGTWESEIPVLGEPFRPVAAPDEVLIVLGNRGGEDAFTHDPTTIGFDLAALQEEYGAAGLPENLDRVDRFFRHEYTHLFQKAWLREHPHPTDSPLQAALADIWAEGLGNYYSLSARWRAVDGELSPTAQETLADLAPRFAARLSALACASAESAAPLLADLSRGRFDRKWGALPAALWLDAEMSRSGQVLGAFVRAGPEGVWDLAERHLPDLLAAVVREARQADSLCRDP